MSLKPKNTEHYDSEISLARQKHTENDPLNLQRGAENSASFQLSTIC